MGDRYENLFGLHARAFEPAADPRFYFPSMTQRKAMSAVSYALNRGAGVVALSGGEGLGKSLLLAHLADQVAGQPVTLALLRADGRPLIAQAAEAFGLAPPENESHALAALEAFLLEEMRRGHRALVLIDDAQALAAASAGDIAAMAGLHHGERSLLQIVLAGDESFARRLAGDEGWSGVQGRTVASHEFEPLLRDEVEPYLRHRLMCAGWEGGPALDTNLAPLLHEACEGVPAAINRAMSALLDDAAARNVSAIEGDALAAWLEGEPGDAEFEVVEPEAAHEPGPALAEAQIAAIENAFAEHDRMLTRLRREVGELRERPDSAPPPPSTGLEARLSEVEARLDQHEAALRNVLERLIVFFEHAGRR